MKWIHRDLIPNAYSASQLQLICCWIWSMLTSSDISSFNLHMILWIVLCIFCSTLIVWKHIWIKRWNMTVQEVHYLITATGDCLSHHVLQSVWLSEIGLLCIWWNQSKQDSLFKVKNWNDRHCNILDVMISHIASQETWDDRNWRMSFTHTDIFR